MPRTERNLAAGVAGALAVAATYVFFLIYAQFGFLHLLDARLGGGAAVGSAMAAMGIAGLVASLLTAVALRRVPANLALLGGLFLSAGSGLVSIVAQSAPALIASGALIGASTAILTVSLAAGLRDFVPPHRVGIVAGVATGAAYLVCNLPALFEGAPREQACVAAVLCTLAAIAVALASLHVRRSAGVRHEPAHEVALFTRAGLAAVVVALLALIWLDSAAFRIIQETAELKGITWGSETQKLIQGLAHVAGAVLAGHLIDRGAFRSIIGVTWILFAASFLAIGTSPSWIVLVGPLYAIGISAYSTALVAYPSLRDDELGLVSRRWRAGLLYGVSGWIGSALGVGMAQDLHDIPNWFLAASGLAIGVALLHRHRSAIVRVFRAAAIPVMLAGAAVVVHVAWQPGAAGSAVERGREVYASEGCVNCHSQYVRPGTFDEVAWGPYHPIDRNERPPFVGNRRQGPDLMNVALRRSPVWNRVHLIDPRALVPGSRMPSYAHLFVEGDSRGDDLVAYLDTRGVAFASERLAAVTAWKPPVNLIPSALQGRAVYLGQCAACHGERGHGDGALAARFRTPVLNLLKPELLSLNQTAVAEPEEVQLARIVKFGLAPSSMPGHETMHDQDVVHVVAYLHELRSHRARLEATRRGSR
ncbi:MAG: cbb3-type cytochrome c oxidase subunit II [Acidobacteria bacterium]|nr:cbb3-type cytochrome c oxidase subunit II [Acidobacteriota bacterium]